MTSHLLKLLLIGMASAPGFARAHMEPVVRGMVLADTLEVGFGGGHFPVEWGLSSWVGGDWNRIWLKSEGEVETDGWAVDGEVQLVYSRLISAFWEVQVGVRGDLIAASGDERGRGHVIVGLEGLAPYWFEVEPVVMVSHTGAVSARLHVSHDLFVTQRLIAESSVEAEAAVQAVRAFGVGSGVNGIELGLRVRYEIAREFAPYAGIVWEQRFGETARFARDEGESAGAVQAVAGVRVWF